MNEGQAHTSQQGIKGKQCEQRGSISQSLDDTPASSCTFFNKDKHQTTYFLAEHGQLYILPLQYQHGYLLNAMPLCYKMVLMTNVPMFQNSNEQNNPDRYYMILGMFL